MLYGERLKDMSYSSCHWLNTSYILSSQQILAKLMEVVSTCSMEDIVLAGGPHAREAKQRTERLSAGLHVRNQLSP